MRSSASSRRPLVTDSWPRVRFDEVLEEVSRPEKKVLDREYPILGAHWYAKGLYTKETKLGHDIKAQTLYRVCEDDFVYNRLFAWMGSFAVATRDNDNCLVSNEFKCFRADRSRLLVDFLSYCFSLQTTWDVVEVLSTGSTPTSRNRLKVERFLNLTIPLPPIKEQQDIVSTIGSIADRVEVSQNHGQKSRRAVGALASSLFNAHADSYPRAPLSELVTLREPDVDVESDVEYNFAGVYSFGRGVFTGATKRGSEFSYRKLTLFTRITLSTRSSWRGREHSVSLGASTRGLLSRPSFPSSR